MTISPFLFATIGATLFCFVALVSAKAQGIGYNPNQNYIQHSQRYHENIPATARYDDGRGYVYANAQPNGYNNYPIYSTATNNVYYNTPSYGYDYSSSSYLYTTPGYQYGSSYYTNNNNNNGYNNYNNNPYYSSSSQYTRYDGRGGYSTPYTYGGQYDQNRYSNNYYGNAASPGAKMLASPQAAWSLISMAKLTAVAAVVIIGQVGLARLFA